MTSSPQGEWGGLHHLVEMSARKVLTKCGCQERETFIISIHNLQENKMVIRSNYVQWGDGVRRETERGCVDRGGGGLSCVARQRWHSRVSGKIFINCPYPHTCYQTVQSHICMWMSVTSTLDHRNTFTNKVHVCIHVHPSTNRARLGEKGRFLGLCVDCQSPEMAPLVCLFTLFVVEEETMDPHLAVLGCYPFELTTI